MRTAVVKHWLLLAGIAGTLLMALGCGGSGSQTPVTTQQVLSVPRQWTWWTGASLANASGNYGTGGAAAPGNTPGARISGAAWTDTTGNLWLFGGDGIDSTGTGGLLNDLWKFDVSSRTWTWEGGSNVTTGLPSYGALGVAAPSNIPGARQDAVSWRDKNGNFWLFGGNGIDSTGNTGLLNDLWQLNPTTLQWTWMGGGEVAGGSGTYGNLGVSNPANVPGARDFAVGWTDPSGMLWLFGGQGIDSTGSAGLLNDLWRFDSTSAQWTWISGSSVEGSIGVYNTLLIASPTSVPGARMRAVSWADTKGNLWLFGGDGYDSTLLPIGPPRGQPHGLLNDLWEYGVSSGTWVWIGGSDLKGAKSSYGTLGMAAASNVPGARAGAAGWTDSFGNFWLFGGNYLNDLWQFDTGSMQWTWVNGSNVSSAPGVYGTAGLSAAANVPGARQNATAWADTRGRFWIIGGQGFDASGFNNPLILPVPGIMNDLWVYQP